MAESDRRNPGTSTATRIDGAVASPTQSAKEQTADGKFRFVERLDGDASVTISRERVFTADRKLSDQFGSLLVITTTGRNDTILIDQRKDGLLDIKVNGKQFLVSLAATQDLAIRTVGGNDTLIASDRVTANIDADGGAGNDVIVLPKGNNRVSGGSGDDTIWLGRGKNYAAGGRGDDVIHLGGDIGVAYGDDGDDILYGGPGLKYLDGGKGNNDRLFASPDGGVLSGLSNKTQAELGAKGGRIFTSDKIDPKLGSSIRIVGTPEFVERVESDINTFRSSPVGKQMLSALDLAAKNKGNSVTIAELSNEMNGFAISSGDTQLKKARDKVIPGKGSDATVKYNPSFFNPPGYDKGFLPAVVLYHELSHAYNIVTGTFQPGLYAGPGIDGSLRVANSERQAVGLRNDGVRYDFDHDNRTAKTTANPKAMTENGIRQDMGLPLRLSYGPPASQSTGNLLNRMVDAALANDPEALKSASAALVASQPAQKFIDEGISALAKLAQVIQQDSPGIEEPTQTPKTQQSIRLR